MNLKNSIHKKEWKNNSKRVPINNTNIESINGLDLSSALERNHVREAVNSILNILKKEQSAETEIVEVTNNDNE